MQVTIEVTQADIDEARVHFGSGGGKCPIALASKRVVGEEEFHWVTCTMLQLTRQRWGRLPDEARDFIVAYDCKKPVAPITFVVDIDGLTKETV